MDRRQWKVKKTSEKTVEGHGKAGPHMIPLSQLRSKDAMGLTMPVIGASCGKRAKQPMLRSCAILDAPAHQLYRFELRMDANEDMQSAAVALS